MGAVIAIAMRDLKGVMRDKFALFWLFAFPLMYALFFGAIFGGDDGGSRSKVGIAVVDDDGSEASASFIERLASHDSLWVEREEGEAEDRPTVLHSLQNAREAVRFGDKVAYIRILEGYGDSPFPMFASGEGSGLEVGIDPSRKAEAGMLQGILMDVVFGGFTTSWDDKGGMREQIAQGSAKLDEVDDIDPVQKGVLKQFLSAVDTFLVDVDTDVLAEGTEGLGGGDLVEVVDVTRERGDEPQSTFEITFPTAMIWGLMTAALSFAITLVRERTNGTLLRLKIAPINGPQILAGKALACFLMCQIVMLFLMAFGYLFLDVRFTSILLVLMSMVSTGICFTGLMMIASVMGKTEQAVAGASWGAMMPFAMIGGGMIPLIAMPPWLLALSDFSPFKWGIYSMEGAIWRGFGMAEMLEPCAILLALGGVFFGLGVWIFRRMEA